MQVTWVRLNFVNHTFSNNNYLKTKHNITFKISTLDIRAPLAAQDLVIECQVHGLLGVLRSPVNAQLESINLYF